MFHMESKNGISIVFQSSLSLNFCFEVNVTPEATCSHIREREYRTAKAMDSKLNDRSMIIRLLLIAS